MKHFLLPTAANEFETSLNKRNAVKSAKRGTMNTIDALIENGNARHPSPKL